ncbi:putative chromo domain-containing protein [Rosellinia necatrix]|uniref:Putative chromo domain-containing protein n=1 Tax=Rosellinia necatrix TaxID=77044 RepID=A0A1W2TTX1_ROSNE|nr:putative chromo domain-containing protein [Rosellinia necatrix]
MTQPPARRRHIEIPLPFKPRDYRPGDGPALAPISLALANDTGAFIVDKRVLPGEPIDGELKLELYYIVGWPDLPAARVSILATRILDYVSPRTLEDWEYKCSLELDEAQEKQEAARQIKQEKTTKAQTAQSTQSVPTTVTGVSTPNTPGTPDTPGKKKRGRPSKAVMLARRIAQQSSFGDDELANVPLPPTSTSGPSLSTPKKKTRARFTTNMNDLDEIDAEEAIFKQLRGDDSESDSDFQAAGVIEEQDEAVKPGIGVGFDSSSAFLRDPSSRGYAEFPIPNPASSTRRNAARSAPSDPSSLAPNSNRKSSSRRWKTQLTIPVPVTSSPSCRSRRRSVSIGNTVTPVPAPSVPSLPTRVSPRTRTLKRPHTVTITPIPAPQYHVSKRQKKSPEVPHKLTYTPIPPPPYPPPVPRSSTKPHKPTCTPIPPPPAPPPPQPFGIAGTNEQTSFAATGRSHGKRVAGVTITVKLDSQPSTPSKCVPSTPQTKDSPKRKWSQVQMEQEWEVKQLEDDNVLETGGRLVRYFKVRWVGDWPEDQNPTWEPEENIAPDVVLNYLRNKAMNVVQSRSSPRRSSRLTPVSSKKYCSVTEEFEDDDGSVSEPNGGLSSESQAEEEEEIDEEEYSYVTGRTRLGTRPRKSQIDPLLLEELAASFGDYVGASEDSES